MNETSLHADLTSSWGRLMDRCAARASERGPILARLLAAYSEPGRHYHNLHHVADVLRVLASMREPLRQPETVELAVWFHDAVYGSRAKDNEERSAELAAECLRRLQISTERIGRVGDLILLTREHLLLAADHDAQALLDADLAILGAPPAVYRAYATAIRREYAWVPDADYRAGRSAVLRRFLDRPRIYGTKELHDRFEGPARQNVSAELAELA